VEVKELVTNPFQFRNALPGPCEATSPTTGVMEEIAFQTSLLALHAALSEAGEKTGPKTPGSPAPPAVSGQRASASEKGRKDF
jgi:hypothetical protein